MDPAKLKMGRNRGGIRGRFTLQGENYSSACAVKGQICVRQDLSSRRANTLEVRSSASKEPLLPGHARGLLSTPRTPGVSRPARVWAAMTHQGSWELHEGTT